MDLLTRQLVLATLSKHETLTLDDLAEPANIGLVPDPNQLTYLLKQLVIRGHVVILSGRNPVTYKVTTEGVAENDRLRNVH